MSEAIIKKNGIDYPLLVMPNHYPADRVYLDGDTTKNVQDKCARKSDLTNLDLTGTTNTTGSTIASGTYFHLNGTLVRAKTAIASGATFTLNTNYEVITVGDELAELTDDSGWQNFTTAYTAKYRKKGSIVEVVVQILNETEIPSQTAVPVGTLPTGFRPAFPVYGVGTVGSTGSEIGYMYVGTNGVVQIINTSASIQKYLVVNMMFFV